MIFSFQYLFQTTKLILISQTEKIPAYIYVFLSREAIVSNFLCKELLIEYM